MGRSRNWHDLRSPIYKIRNIKIVDTDALTVHCEFQRVRITGVPLARCQTSKNATWGQVTYCDLVTWPLGSSGRRFFRNVSNCWLNNYGKFGGATRRRFFAICEKPYGGGGGLKSTLPAGARVNIEKNITKIIRVNCMHYTLAFSFYGPWIVSRQMVTLSDLKISNLLLLRASVMRYPCQKQITRTYRVFLKILTHSFSVFEVQVPQTVV